MCNCKVRISVATAQTLVLILDDAVATVGSLSEFVLMFSKPECIEVLSFRWKGGVEVDSR